jgi:hypothetical protein
MAKSFRRTLTGLLIFSLFHSEALATGSALPVQDIPAVISEAPRSEALAARAFAGRPVLNHTTALVVIPALAALPALYAQNPTHAALALFEWDISLRTVFSYDLPDLIGIPLIVRLLIGNRALGRENRARQAASTITQLRAAGPIKPWIAGMLVAAPSGIFHELGHGITLRLLFDDSISQFHMVSLAHGTNVIRHVGTLKLWLADYAVLPEVALGVVRLAGTFSQLLFAAVLLLAAKRMRAETLARHALHLGAVFAALRVLFGLLVMATGIDFSTAALTPDFPTAAHELGAAGAWIVPLAYLSAGIGSLLIIRAALREAENPIPPRDGSAGRGLRISNPSVDKPRKSIRPGFRFLQSA